MNDLIKTTEHEMRLKGMGGTCETVNIVSAESPTGHKTINKVDMQPTDKLYIEK